MKSIHARALGFGCLAITLLAASHAVLAGNASFLKDTPLEVFTEEDQQLMFDNAEAALSDAKTPAKREWKNPKTGSSGSAESLTAFTGPKNESCKRVQIVNHAQGRTSKGNYTVCNMGADGWKLVPSDYAKPKMPEKKQ